MSLNVEAFSDRDWHVPDTWKGKKDVGAVNKSDTYVPARLYFGNEDGRLIPIRHERDIRSMFGEQQSSTSFTSMSDSHADNGYEGLSVKDMLDSYLPTDFQFEYSRDQMKNYVLPFIKKSKPENRFIVPDHMLPSYWHVLNEDGSVNAEKRDSYLADLMKNAKIAQGGQFTDILTDTSRLQLVQQISKKLYRNPLENPHLPLWQRTQDSARWYGLAGFGTGTLSGIFYWYGLGLFNHHYVAWQLITGTAVRYGTHNVFFTVNAIYLNVYF